MRDLTQDEREALHITSILWNQLNKLKVLHIDDMEESRRDIHNIQNRIMCRPAQEEYYKKNK